MSEYKRKPKSRGNGQGTAYKRGNTWTAQVVVGWKNGCPVKRTKGGFATKRDAINYCPTLLANPGAKKTKKLNDYWEYYEENDYSRLSSSQKTSYKIRNLLFPALPRTGNKDDRLF